MKKQFYKKIKKDRLTFSKPSLLSVMILLGVILFSTSAYAQQVAANAQPQIENDTLATNGIISILLCCTILLLLATFIIFVKTRNVISQAKNGIYSSKVGSSFLDKFNASVAIEHEKDILMDHDYDGIKELDNNLPPWWKYGFYLTIVIAICYLTYFHLLGGDLQIARYEKSLVEAKAAQEAYQKEHGDIINDANVKLITDKVQLAEAEKIFKASCSPCHGMDAHGVVGPNLTDDYWIHGGSIKNVFKTITNGYPEKGMKSWKTDFSALQINQLASYVKSLRGTNPPNPKEKQGDLYVEEGAVNAVVPAKDSANAVSKGL